MLWFRRLIVTFHLGGLGLISEQFVVYKVILGQVFLTENFGFPRLITIPPMLHVHSSFFFGMDNSQWETAVTTKPHPIKKLTTISEISSCTWSCGRWGNPCLSLSLFLSLALWWVRCGHCSTPRDHVRRYCSVARGRCGGAREEWKICSYLHCWPDLRKEDGKFHFLQKHKYMFNFMLYGSIQSWEKMGTQWGSASALYRLQESLWFS